MKKKMSTITTTFALSIISAAVTFSSCANSNGSTVSESQVDSLREQIKQLTANDATIATNLAKFDTLDYTVFTNQQWDRLHESHAADIKVYWPDGHMTEGIEKHIEDLKALFVFAPDTRIKEHPIRIGSGNL